MELFFDFLVLVLGLTLFHLLYQTYLSPLKNFPGPLLWKISSIPYFLSVTRGRSHRDILVLHQKYGAVVRIAPKQLSYANEIAWKDVWGHRQGHAEFPKVNKPVPVNGVQGILGADREAHSKFRRAFAHAFSVQGLREQEPRITNYVDMLLDGLASHGTTKPVDLVPWFTWMTFDLIGDLAFGESFGCLENAQSHPWITDIFGNVVAATWLNLARESGLGRIIPYVMPRRLIQARLENAQFASARMSSRVQKGSGRGDFFDKILAKGVGEGGMTPKELESNASSLVLAGSETTATMLSGTVALLLQHRRVLTKLTDNIRKAYGSADDITIESCSRDTYLLAVLDEVMRLYPAVTSVSGRRVPMGGDTVGGVFLPEGTCIQFYHFAAYRLDSNFTDPNSFAPERWLSDPRFSNDNKAAFQPFSFGPRNCIGRNLAYAEMRLVVTKLLWRFDLTAPSDGQDVDQWQSRQRSFVLWEKIPLFVNVKARTIDTSDPAVTSSAHTSS